MALKPSGRKRPGPPTLKALKDRKTMSKINLNAPIRTRSGEPMIREGAQAQTLGLLLLDIIDGPLIEGDDKPERKLRLVRIGSKIEDALAGDGEIELSKADCTLLLDRATKFTNTLGYGQLVRALDPDLLKADA